ncbi:MAG: hypothetical protein WC551_08605 [Patescibacteria group bacterium]
MDRYFLNQVRSAMNDALWAEAETEVKSLGPQVREIVREIYPDRETLIGETQTAVQDLVYRIAKTAVHQRLGVKLDTFDHEVEYDRNYSGIEALVEKFESFADAAIKKLDVETLMHEVITEELEKFIQSPRFMDTARNVAQGIVQEKMIAVLNEVVKTIDFDAVPKPSKPAPRLKRKK